MVIPRIQVRVVGAGQKRPSSVVVNDINTRGHLGGPGGGGFDVATPDTGAGLAGVWWISTIYYLAIPIRHDTSQPY